MAEQAQALKAEAPVGSLGTFAWFPTSLFAIHYCSL